MFSKNIKQFCTLFSRPRFYAKNIANNLKGKNVSSQKWLERQLSDPYVERARLLNYRCRSAFKLIEIDDKYKLIKPGDVIVDCGAAPGSWSQVAVQRSNADGNMKRCAKGAVYSIDMLQFHPIKGATIFSSMDFTKQESQLRLKETLNGRSVNCILSDMAPNATGIKMLDQENITRLCYHVLQFALIMSALQGHLVVKVWDNADVTKLERIMQQYYANVKRVKPLSSRGDSSEIFIVARNFKYISTTTSNKTNNNINFNVT